MIRALLDAGLRVGVTAQSHAVVSHLLEAVGRPALQKCDAGRLPHRSTACGVPATNDEVVAALASGSATLVGGTAWLWARDDLRGPVDVLVVDEAGQFSLANAVAVSPAARSLVLLGDPQQLTQPTQAIHPDGAGVSALEHLLDGHDTHPAGPRRLPRPDVPDAPATHGVRVRPRRTRAGSPPRPAASGSTSRRPVRCRGTGCAGCRSPHDGNTSASTAGGGGRRGARRRTCAAATWIDAEGVERRLGLEDVLVVAPYNAHVAACATALPEGARVGTVDKFQGQQAPVVIYSMASSSAADAPRGVAFLYDLHRLNVAISRAKAISVVVASPAAARRRGAPPRAAARRQRAVPLRRAGRTFVCAAVRQYARILPPSRSR